MKDVTVTFSCGHTGLVTAALFKEGEEIPLPCRECKPSVIMALLYVGALASVGSMGYGGWLGDTLIAAGGAVAVVVVVVLLVIFRK
jgi:hypothetical protein